MGDWQTARLDEVLSFREGPGIMAADFREQGVPLIRLAGLKKGTGLLSGCNFLDPAKVELKWKQFRLRVGDVLLSTSASLGEVATVTRDSEGAIPYTGIISFRPADGRIDRAFIQHMLTDPAFTEQIAAMGVGSVMNHFGPSHLRQMTVRFPTVQEQQAIAQVLGALDDKIAANERISRSALELAHSLVLCVMRSTDTRMPELTRTKFGALGELLDGPHATPTRRSEGPYFLNISSLKSGRLDLAESDHLSEEDFSTWTRRVTPQAGDLLFSYETRIGEAALMPGGVRACLGRRMALLRPDRTRVDPVFLLHFYLSPAFQRIIAAHTIHGATVPRIRLATMPDWDVEIPTFEEQQVVAGALGSLHEVVVQSQRESGQLATVRDELLPLLMSGKVRVKDAETAVSEVL